MEDNYSLRPVKVSTINFVDLAGSERGSYSGHEGNADRIRQTEVCPCLLSGSTQPWLDPAAHGSVRSIVTDCCIFALLSCLT